MFYSVQINMEKNQYEIHETRWRVNVFSRSRYILQTWSVVLFSLRTRASWKTNMKLDWSEDVESYFRQYPIHVSHFGDSITSTRDSRAVEIVIYWVYRDDRPLDWSDILRDDLVTLWLPQVLHVFATKVSNRQSGEYQNHFMKVFLNRSTRDKVDGESLSLTNEDRIFIANLALTLRRGQDMIYFSSRGISYWSVYSLSSLALWISFIIMEKKVTLCEDRFFTDDLPNLCRRTNGNILELRRVWHQNVFFPIIPHSFELSILFKEVFLDLRWSSLKDSSPTLPRKMNVNWLIFSNKYGTISALSRQTLRLWVLHPGGESLSLTFEDHLFIDDLPTIRRDERRDTAVTIEFSIVSGYSLHILENIS